MDDRKALAVVSALANGVHPLTGEVFGMDSPYQQADVVRALYVAVRAIEANVKTQSRKTAMPRNAGQPWNEAEDRQLVQRFDEGLTVKQIAKAHGRTVAGIEARLERLGKIEAKPRTLKV